MPVDFSGFAREYLDGAMVMTPATRRTPPQSLESKAKICNKMNHGMALWEARQVHPCCLPLMLDTDGNIGELNAANFFFVSDGKGCTTGPIAMCSAASAARRSSISRGSSAFRSSKATSRSMT